MSGLLWCTVCERFLMEGPDDVRRDADGNTVHVHRVPVPGEPRLELAGGCGKTAREHGLRPLQVDLPLADFSALTPDPLVALRAPARALFTPYPLNAPPLAVTDRHPVQDLTKEEE